MPRSILSQALMTASAMAMVASPVLATAASAQDAPPMQGGDYRNPPPEPAAPQGYDGRDLPPPPTDYVPPVDADTQRAEDQQYAAAAQRWAAENCVKSRGDVGKGALVGGILGAIIGGGLGGRHNGGGAMAAGAAIGAIGGAAVASSSGGDTSPGCPQGYVLRSGASAYVYPQSDYYYAAPSWYRPWVFVDGMWVYRPYPYHDWYYRTYRGYRGYYGHPRTGPGHDFYRGPGYRRP